jgi:hypothetical protein
MEDAREYDNERPDEQETISISDELFESFEEYFGDVNAARSARGESVQPIKTREQFEKWWRARRPEDRDEWQAKFKLGYHETQAETARIVSMVIDSIPWDDLPPPERKIA